MANTRFVNAADFRSLVVRQTGEHRVYLGDIASVERGPKDDDVHHRADGKPAIGLSVLRQSQANTVQIADTIASEPEIISKQLPAGTTLTVAKNEAAFIESLITQVSKVLLETTVIVAVVIWLFLGSLRTAMISVITIPISLLGALGAMALADFTVNVITLFALILAIGLVVDDAIVVLEKIERRVREGESPKEAVLNGSNQVTVTIVATTVVLIAAFVPISLLEGEVGSLFREFGVVLAVAVTISGFLALSRCPVLAASLSHAEKPGRVAAAVDRVVHGLTRGYSRLVGGAVDRPLIMLGLAAFIAALSAGCYDKLPKQLSPAQDRGTFSIDIDAPQGASLAYTDQATKAILERCHSTVGKV